jgi:fucose 4-O-acetylase-like acetyltransferase
MTPLTKAQFRWLLVLYCLVVAMEFAVESNTKQLIPTSVLDAENASSRAALLQHSRPEQIAIIASVAGVLVAGAVGLVAMFFLSRVGAYIFLVAVCVRTAMSPVLYPWHVSTGWKTIFGETSVILEGAIFALIYLGPAKHLFGQRKQSNHALEATAGRRVELP